MAGLRVTIYTDSKYAFLIAHSHAAIWKERGFLATRGTPTVNGKTIHHLLQALQEPKEVAIVHCRGHQTGTDPITNGNAIADATARQLTSGSDYSPELFLSPSLTPNYSKEEKQQLLDQGRITGQQGWIHRKDRTALPQAQAREIVSTVHQFLHNGPDATYRFLSPIFAPPGLQKTINQVHKACTTCHQLSSQGALKRRMVLHQLQGGTTWTGLAD